MSAAIQIEIDSEAGITRIALRGVIRFLEVQDLCARARSVDDRTSNALVDLSAANLGLTYDDIESLARFSPLFSNIAIFAPRPIAFGVSRMYQQMSAGSGQRISVFANHDEAIKSLKQNMAAPRPENA